MYRCWTHELEETVKKVEIYMEDACDQYFQDIKPRAVKVILRKHYRNLTTLKCHHIFYRLIPITLVLPSKSCHMVKGQLLYMYVHTNRLFLKLCMDMPANGCRCHPQNPQPSLNYCCTSRSLDIKSHQHEISRKYYNSILLKPLLIVWHSLQSIIYLLFPMQYFYQDYCLKTRDYLEEFDTEFEEELRRENERQKKV